MFQSGYRSSTCIKEYYTDRLLERILRRKKHYIKNSIHFLTFFEIFKPLFYMSIIQPQVLSSEWKYLFCLRSDGAYA